MKKIKNPWMISTIAVSILSVIVIGVLSYQLLKVSATSPEFPSGSEGPSQGQMPSGGKRGWQEDDTETSETTASENTNI